MCTEDIIAENLEHRISQPTAEDTKNEDQNESVLILVRSWVAIALRRRSVDLLCKYISRLTSALVCGCKRTQTRLSHFQQKLLP